MSSSSYENRPSVCRSCGAIVGAGEAACGVCGAAVGAATAAQDEKNRGARIINERYDAGERHAAERQERRDAQGEHPPPDRETMNFARALFQRPATFTMVFLLMNVGIFILMTLAGGTSNFEVLQAFGAKINSLINAGEWWRLITPIFLHGGVIHLLMNMYGLWMLGPYVERLYGSAKFVVIWIATGIAGVVASYYSLQPELAESGGFIGRFLFKSADFVSVGASGALFGLIGVLFVFGIKYRHELPAGFKQAFGTGMLPTILLNVVIGYAIPVIDNAAHLGGLVAGALLALVFGYKRVGPRGGVSYIWHLLQIVALAVVALAFLQVLPRARAFDYAPQDFFRRLSGDPLINSSPLNQGAQPSNLEAYVNAYNEAQTSFASALSGDASRVDAAIEGVKQAPHLDDDDAALREQLVALLERAKGYAQLPPEQRRRREAQTSEQLKNDYNDWQERRLKWIETNGEKFDIKIIRREQKTVEPNTEQNR